MSCQPASSPPEPVPISHTYSSIDGPILNPERGFFASFQLPGSADFSSLRNQGYSLVHLNIHLDRWRETDLPPDVLSGLDKNFADLRQAGSKAIVRFSYNQGFEPDASKEQILRHIHQLAPLLQTNADVVAWVEAGFIGAWGEWHNSTNGLDNIEDKKQILFALLEAVPKTRMLQVRYPYDIYRIFPTPAEAVRARIAHHNDCFLSSDTDVGTYEHDGLITIEIDQAYLSELTRYTPMSGETCALNPPRSDCTTALKEMALLHFSALSGDYHADVLRSWKDGGCMEEINRRLGYRLVLKSASFNEQVHPGGVLRLSVDLQNSGFASVINKRPLYIVLDNLANTTSYKVKLDVDPRTWEPGAASFMVRLHLPSNMPEGVYKLGLWLPDEYASIRENPAYAIRFANKNVWEDSTGVNLLGTVRVSKGTLGSYQWSQEFQVIELISSNGTQK